MSKRKNPDSPKEATEYPLKQRLRHDDEEVVDDRDVDDVDLLADEENPLHVATSGSGHFIGIQPEGNLFFSSVTNCRAEGLGVLSRLEDSYLLDNFFACFTGKELARMACVSKSFYAFIYGSDTELWRERTLALTKGNFTFQWMWRVTYAAEYQRLHPVSSPTFALEYCHAETQKQHSYEPVSSSPDYTEVYPTRDSAMPTVKLTDFFSDTLFQPWYCADAILANSSSWEREYNVDRVDAKSLTVEQFRERYEIPCKPVAQQQLVQEAQQRRPHLVAVVGAHAALHDDFNEPHFA
jgi:hypothetical protein